MKKIFDRWFKSMNISLISYKETWSTNGIGRLYNIYTNGATIHDKCFDFKIHFGYLILNITLFDMDNYKLIRLLRRFKK